MNVPGVSGTPDFIAKGCDPQFDSCATAIGKTCGAAMEAGPEVRHMDPHAAHSLSGVLKLMPCTRNSNLAQQLMQSTQAEMLIWGVGGCAGVYGVCNGTHRPDGRRQLLGLVSPVKRAPHPPGSCSYWCSSSCSSRSSRCTGVSSKLIVVM